MIFLPVFFGGCAGSILNIIKPLDVKMRVSTLQLAEGISTVEIPDEEKKMFGEILSKTLYSEGNFKKGPDLKLEYRFTNFDAGSRAMRYFVGMTMEEAATALGIPLRTAERLWTYSRAWLRRKIGEI